MLVAGIMLVALAMVAFPIAFLTALLGFGDVAAVSYTIAKFAWLLAIPGVVLVALGLQERDQSLPLNSR